MLFYDYAYFIFFKANDSHDIAKEHQCSILAKVCEETTMLFEVIGGNLNTN